MNTFGHPVARFFYSEYDGYQRNFWERDLWEDTWKETLDKIMNPSSRFTNTPIWVEVTEWVSKDKWISSCRMKVDSWEKVLEIVNNIVSL